MHYKTNHNDPVFQSCDFLQTKITPTCIEGSMLPRHIQARGIQLSKKQNILKHLGHLMPRGKQQFWTSLRESESVDFLTQRESK